MSRRVEWSIVVDGVRSPCSLKTARIIQALRSMRGAVTVVGRLVVD